MWYTMTKILVKVFVIYISYIAKCEEYIGGSIAAIGPDTFGFLARYRKALTSTSEDDKGTVKVSDYISRKEAIQKVETEMLAKYKEVNAILLSTSRYYYNYRHPANVLAMSSRLYDLGLVSRHNILMLATETCLCHPTNSFPGRMYVGRSVNIAAYKGEIEEDEGNVFLENMYIPYHSSGTRLNHLRFVMTQRFPPKFPRSSRIATKYRVELESMEPQLDLSAQLVYMTGHGGDRYFQFQAKDMLAANDIELYMSEFFVKHPNVHTLMITDTCQASTMFEGLDKAAPLAWVASSPRGMSSYSYNANSQLTVSTVGKFSYYLSSYITNVVRGIKERGDRVAASRFSLWQLKRHMERHCPEESPVFHANNRLLLDGSHAAMHDTEEATGNKSNATDIKKVYLGQFVFSYRVAYFNGYRWTVEVHTKSNHSTPLEMQRYEDFNSDNELILNFEGERLHVKMREGGFMTSTVRSPSMIQIVAAISFCVSSIFVAAVMDPATFGTWFIRY